MVWAFRPFLRRWRRERFGRNILKRGVYGTCLHVSEANLHRYLSEFDFRYNSRKWSDAERAAEAVRGVVGKRLTYHQPRKAAQPETEGSARRVSETKNGKRYADIPPTDALPADFPA